MMRKFSLVLLLAMTLQSLANAETIHYSIRQMGFDGQATLTFVGPKEFKNHKTILIIFRAHGVNYWDQENIYVNPKTYRPLFVERDFSLNVFGHGKILEEYHPREIIITKTTDGKVTKQYIHKEGPVDNIYGFIYHYRREGSFKIGDTIKMVFPTKDVKLKLIKRVPLKIKAKTYDTYYMESQPRKYKIWFDGSPNKIPLRISGSLGFINSVMTMTDYEQ
jgi:hypothetical protein